MVFYFRWDNVKIMYKFDIENYNVTILIHTEYFKPEVPHGRTGCIRFN